MQSPQSKCSRVETQTNDDRDYPKTCPIDRKERGTNIVDPRHNRLRAGVIKEELELKQEDDDSMHAYLLHLPEGNDEWDKKIAS